MTDRTVTYKMFHLIKDVLEGGETTKTIQKKGSDVVKVINTYTSIKRRYFLKYFSWILEIHSWTTEYEQGKEK